MNEKLERFIEVAAEVIAAAQRIAVLTGAGVSAESGVGTFRDAQTGLWSRFDPQQLASQEGFAVDPGKVWRWYMHRLEMVERAHPNPGHAALAALEAMTPTFTLITQNVDDLHERAGSHNVLHLHGRLARFHCNGCGLPYTLRTEDRDAPMPPTCTFCTDYIRPSVVWFGELLPAHEITEAQRAAEMCDVFLVVGTSGVVYPAAHLPVIAKRRSVPIIEVNPEESALSEIAEIRLSGPSGAVLPRLVEAVRFRRAGQENPR